MNFVYVTIVYVINRFTAVRINLVMLLLGVYYNGALQTDIWWRKDDYLTEVIMD